MSIEFSCEHCGVDLRVGEEKAGIRSTCPKCQEPIKVPQFGGADSSTVLEEDRTGRDFAAAEPATSELSPVTMPSAGAPSRQRPSGQFRPQAIVVWVVTLGMLIMLVSHLLYIAAMAYQLTLLKRVQRGDFVDQETLELSDVFVGGPAILYVLALLGTSVFWMVWKYGANKNVRTISDQRFEYTPGWTVGCYFVPFANLVWPFNAMKEIWKASSPSGTESALVGWWWGLWILSGVVSQISMRLSRNSETLDEFIRDSQIELLIAPVEIAVILVAGVLVWRIHRMQLRKAGLLNDNTDDMLSV